MVTFRNSVTDHAIEASLLFWVLPCKDFDNISDLHIGLDKLEDCLVNIHGQVIFILEKACSINLIFLILTPTY